MILELRLPDDSLYREVVVQKTFEAALCRMIGFDSISTYCHHSKSVSGWKDGKEYMADCIGKTWKKYPITDNK